MSITRNHPNKILDQSPNIPAISQDIRSDKRKYRIARTSAALLALTAVGLGLEVGTSPAPAKEKAVASSASEKFDVTFKVTEGNTAAAQSILDAEGNHGGDTRPIESQLSIAEDINGQVPNGVAKGETVSNIDFSGLGISQNDANSAEVTVHYDGK